ncbi:MAG: hypothetical protein ACKOJF_03795, partial [Planctomycetaceae bacterium]
EQEQLADLTSEMADILAQALDPGDDADDESAEMDNTADPEADDNDPGFLPRPGGDRSPGPGDSPSKKVEDLPDVD